MPRERRFAGDPRELLSLVFARPRDALAGAHAVLADSPSPYHASIAHHAIGLVQREFGDLEAAIPRLRRALALARRSGSVERQADVLATLGIALIHAGRTTAGLGMLDGAISRAKGVSAARVRFRRAGALWVLGRHDAALADLRAAIPVLRKANDTIWTARAVTVRGLIHLALGSVDRAGLDFELAEQLFARTDQDHDTAVARHNRGLVAFRSGDLPTALECFDEVERRYRSLGTPMPELVIDRCAVLLAAGLATDALGAADAAVEDLVRQHGRATRRAELLLVAANAALAAGNPTTAADRARAASRLFTAQRREWWRAHVGLPLVQARLASGPASPRLLAQAEDTARHLAALGSPDVVQARLLAGRVALALGRPAAAARFLGAAAQARLHGPAVSRVDGWLAQALLAGARGDRRTMLIACRRGLDLLDEHRLTLGAAELRARATAHGAELAELAQRAWLHAGRELLIWSERWRGTTGTVPAVRPPDDRAVRRDLAALREVTGRLDRARQKGLAVQALRSERLVLEHRIRARALRTPGRRGRRSGDLDVAALLDELGSGQLVEIIGIDGQVHVLICGGGRVRRVAAGRTADAIGDVESARWVLRRLSYGALSGRSADLLSRIETLGKRLEATLLGPAAAQLGDGPVVIVPPGRLHAVPWALLPSLTDRVHSVAPSATAWRNARAARQVSGSVVLVCGPGLSGAEVPALAGMYRGARVLADGSATAGRVLEALDGSSLAHIAAHGSFRADNPLFSSLRLDDGPLTVYDFERLRRAPYRLVLPACESGRLQPIGADELLGLSTALLPLGTAGIVASLVPVNDPATVPVMLALHGALRRGATLAEALCVARRAAGDDPVCQATARSFIALGPA